MRREWIVSYKYPNGEAERFIISGSWLEMAKLRAILYQDGCTEVSTHIL